MKNRRLFFFATIALSLALSVALSVDLMNTSVAARDKKDTVEDVMKAGNLTLGRLDNLVADLERRVTGADDKTKASLNTQINVLRKLRPLIVRLAQDRTFCAKVLEPSLKNDRAALGDILRRETPGLGLEVQEIRDWSVWGVVTFSKYEKYEVCVGSDCKGGAWFRQI